MQPIELVRILDRIRDEELGLTRLCERFAESMQTALQVREVQLLVHNPDMGTLENPVPGRAISAEVLSLFDKLVAVPGDQAVRIADHIMALPLRPRDPLLGWLILRSIAALEPEVLNLASLAAEMIDSALEHALIFGELQLRNKQLQAIFELDHLRDQHLPFHEMIVQAAERIRHYTKADSAAVMLYTEPTGVIDIRLAADDDQHLFDCEDCLKALRAIAQRSFELRGMVSVDQLHPQIGATLCMPLILSEDIIGAFVAMRMGSQPFDNADRQMLSAMASQIDTAIFEDRQRRHIKSVFKRYVAPDVVEKMLQSDQDFLSGQRREISVLFSDLRGFTSMSERLDTDVVVKMINQHLSAMCEVVLRNRGTLDKFIGDCVMAFWGAPIDDDDHAWDAVRTAIQMREAHATLMEEWQREGLEPIQVGIGINTGEVFVGNIGDARKSSYTVIGDSVNLASRLEGVALGGQILVTDRTLKLLGNRVMTEHLPPVAVKGKQAPIAIHNVIGLS